MTRSVDRCSFIYCEDVIDELSILDVFVKLSVIPSQSVRSIVAVLFPFKWMAAVNEGIDYGQKQLLTSVETEMLLRKKVRVKIKVAWLTVEKLFARN